ncbi:hypothetical protein GCM10018780_80060 [Streptomyces lanatus]|nr:hypothetical protein GCM10018780_80060 [Streptomyces lanatus]
MVNGEVVLAISLARWESATARYVLKVPVATLVMTDLPSSRPMKVTPSHQARPNGVTVRVGTGSVPAGAG